MSVRSVQLVLISIFLPLCIKTTFVLSSGDDANIKCKERGRQALLKFKQGLIDEYRHLSSWGNEEHKKDCCKWKGVSCSNQTGQVIGLNLQFRAYMPLRGNTGPALLELEHLNYLNMKYNDFGGKKVPEFIGSLKKLRYLDLSNAGFTGRVPYQLGNLSSLQYLDLSYNFNMFSENLEWLSHLSSLKDIRLNQFNLREATDWLQVVSQLPFLTELQLRGCNLPSVNSSSVSFNNSSKSLSYLDLSLNDVSNSVYFWLFNSSSNLVYLDLSSNKLQGPIPDYAFPNPTSLSYLDLSNNHIVNVPKSFRNFCKLKTLYLDSNNLTGLLPRLFLDLSNCSRDTLEILSLNSNMLQGSLPDITVFSSLEELHLYDNRLDGSLPKSFRHQSNLTILELDSNHLGGLLPDFSVFLSIKVLYLNNNRFIGTLKTKSVGQLSQLELLDVASNSLEGMITEAHLSNLSRITYLDLSHNSLILNFSSGWVPPFQLNNIRLGACKQGPHFPKWLRTQQKFSELDISDAGISDLVPYWFWDLSSNLYYLNLSHNHLTGMLPDLSHRFTRYPPEIDLSSNSFEGSIPPIPITVTSLILSKNKFSGSILFLCDISGEFRYLDLSDNLLSGELPDCLRNWQKLTVLNLANNNFSGKIPNSMDISCMMQSLHLRNNSFFGELPSSLKNCTQLTVLDLGNNEFSGKIPAWIGDSLQELVVLSLRSNQFHESVPIQLCHLKKLQVLDLSENNISGAVPSCLNNLTAMTQKESSNAKITYPLRTDYYNDHALFVWKRMDSEYRNTLGLVKSIDLSSNKLHGEIPDEVMTLVGLISLNLSRNSLIGPITAKIGRLTLLNSLDLSNNMLTGEIPQGFSQLSLLGVLDLSNNNFSRKIPSSTQLQSFDASTYMENPELCGLPLPNKCPGQEQAQHPAITEQADKEDGIVTTGFYVSIVLGFITGFWGVCGTLLLNSTWRYAYFRL